MADSPTSVTPQSNPAISDPAMDTNQIYEHESERPQQVSPDSDIQLAQLEPLDIKQGPLLPSAPIKLPRKVDSGYTVTPNGLTTTGYTDQPSVVTHDIVQAPDGARVAFPKGTDPATIHTEMTKWWQPHLQRTKDAWNGLTDIVSNTAAALGLPSSGEEVNGDRR